MKNMFFISDKIIILMSMLVTAFYIWILKYKDLDKKKSKVSFLIYCNIIINLCIVYYFQRFVLIEHLIMGLMILFCFITIIILKRYDLYNEKIRNFFTMFLIIVIQLGYVIYSPYYIRQHDSRSFIHYQNGGHFGYIGYIYFNKSLPIESPADYWCFANPPLFHILSAIFLTVQEIFQGITLDACFENIERNEYPKKYCICFGICRAITSNDYYEWKLK